MKRSILTLALLATLGLAACDNRPEVIYMPPPAAGPPGASGSAVNPGGASQPVDGATTIVTPPLASAPAK